MPRTKSPDPTDIHVGSRVRMRRMTLGMSQQKLGDALGLSFQQVQKYEKGMNRIGSSRLQKIAHVLQSPVAFFFEGAAPGLLVASGAEAPSPAFVDEFIATSDGIAIAKSFGSIRDAKVRRHLVCLIEAMAGAR